MKNNTLGLGASVSQEVSGGNRTEATQTHSSSAYTHTKKKTTTGFLLGFTEIELNLQI